MPSFKLGPEMKIRTRQFCLSMPRLSGIRCASVELLARTKHGSGTWFDQGAHLDFGRHTDCMPAPLSGRAPMASIRTIDLVAARMDQ